MVALALRVHGLGGRPLVLLATVAALAVATALAIIASSLLTDIFAGLGVLALYLLVMRRTALAAWERGALSGLLAFAAATHSGVPFQRCSPRSPQRPCSPYCCARTW